jgi:hypothetical protein
MDLGALMDSRSFTYLILPLLIFTARVLDVTLGTIRIVFVSRGKKYLAFYSVEDVRQVSRGVFPARKPV